MFQGLAWFTDATFLATVDFSSAVFLSDARFDRVTFRRGATFSSAEFRGVACFDQAEFGDAAFLDRMTCYGNLSVDGTRFEAAPPRCRTPSAYGGLWANRTVFGSRADVRGLEVHGRTWLVGAAVADDANATSACRARSEATVIAGFDFAVAAVQSTSAAPGKWRASEEPMETVGFVGVGKIGLPISENLIKSGYRVLGYRREPTWWNSRRLGGIPARSPADIGAQADIVFSCLPSSEALDEVVQGPQGLAASARPGQIVIELGSHPLPDKERQIAPLAAKGAVFLDGEVSGTPGMVAARKAVIYLAGDEAAAKKAERVVGGFAELVPLFRQVRRREPGQARQQSPGGDQHRRHRRGDGARA